jgi:hypothetical protein
MGFCGAGEGGLSLELPLASPDGSLVAGPLLAEKPDSAPSAGEPLFSNHGNVLSSSEFSVLSALASIIDDEASPSPADKTPAPKAATGVPTRHAVQYPRHIANSLTERVTVIVPL